MSSGDRPKSRRRKSWMLPLLICTFIFALLLLLFTPTFHDKYFGLAQNESAAIGSLLKINEFQKQYAAAHPGKGFACELHLLRPTEPTNDGYNPTTSLLTGKWSGFKFTVVGCTPDARGIVSKYQVVAVPSILGITGTRAFCTDETREIFYDPSASASECVSLHRALP